ncbi:MAG: NAD(P)H-dependent oxidoreductase subunit E [Elusimicrobia bacterium]|nr:NAD(P)H-dependent oxidoreductase subunit E [Elusimicrobiota bacterium]
MSHFSAEQEQTLMGWARRYPYRIMGLLEALRQVQEWRRCVGDQDEEYLAKLFDYPRNHVHELVTFFPGLTLRPTGRYRVGICRGLSCALAGSAAMCRCMEKSLGIKAGETTPDGKFSFETMECIGACDHAPALIVNDKLQGAASEQSISELLERLP